MALPEGFTLEAPPQSSGVNLPEGFTLETPSKYDVSPEFIKKASKSLARGESPILAGAADLLSGLTTLPRQALNTVSNLFPAQNNLASLVTGQKPENNLGNVVLPQGGVDQNSKLNLTGQLLDPYAMTLGAGAYNAATSAPKVAALWPIAQRAIGGAAAGGLVGATEGQPLEGAGIGAGVSAVLPPIISGGSKLAGWLWDAARGKLPGTQAGNIAREAAGSNLDAIKAANTGSVASNLNAAQAAASAGINQDTWQALAKYAESGDKNSFYRVLGDTQRQNDIDTLARMAGGATQTEAKGARQAAQSTLNAVTTPMRNTELNAANTAGQTISSLAPEVDQRYQSMVSALQNQGKTGTEAAQAGVRADAGKPGFLSNGDRAQEWSGAAQDFGAVANQRKSEGDFIQSQIDSLAAHGLKPLDASSITSAIQTKLADPTIGPNKLNNRVLSNISDLIQKWTDNNGGVIDARALYEIRKSAVNNEIGQLLSGADPKAQAKAAAGLAMEIKPMIDNAIEQAGGTDWRKYLGTFEAGMRDINSQQLSAKAMELYQKSPAKFVDLVNGNDPKTVEKVFGPGKYDIEDVMGDKYPVLKQIADNVERNKAITTQATAGATPLKSIVDAQGINFRLPFFPSKAVSATNQVLDKLEGAVSRKTLIALSEGMKNGESANALLATLPTSERNVVLNALRTQPQKWLPIGLGATVQQVNK